MDRSFLLVEAIEDAEELTQTRLPPLTTVIGMAVGIAAAFALLLTLISVYGIDTYAAAGAFGGNAVLLVAACAFLISVFNERQRYVYKLRATGRDLVTAHGHNLIERDVPSSACRACRELLKIEDRLLEAGAYREAEQLRWLRTERHHG